jgi:hypothetical protein
MSWLRYFRRRYWDHERSRELQAYLEIETGENIARRGALRRAQEVGKPHANPRGNLWRATLAGRELLARPVAPPSPIR